MKNIFFLFLCLFLIQAHLSGQRKLIGVSKPQNSEAPSSLAVDSSNIQDEQKENFFKTLFKGQPGKALMWSTLPGGGQIYNRRYWKVPFVYAGLGATAYLIIQRRKIYQIYDEAFRMRVDLGEQSQDRFIGIYDTDVLQNFRREADKALFESYVWFGLVYLVSGIEAYVDRHLMEFDISDNLSLEVRPTLVGPSANPSLSFGVEYSF